jgi:hypothetical protein
MMPTPFAGGHLGFILMINYRFNSWLASRKHARIRGVVFTKGENTWGVACCSGFSRLTRA